MPKKVKVTRFNSVGEPSMEPAKKYIAVFLVIVLVLGGYAIGRKTAPTPVAQVNSVKKSPVSEVLTGAGPFNTKTIVPSKFEKSTDGAIAAASTYILNSTRVYLMNDAAFDKAITQISTAQFKSDLNRGMNASRVAMQSVFEADPNAFYREFPMGYVVVDEREDSVTVNVWTLLMLVAKPEFNGNTESKVHSLTLDWEKGDWKLAAWTNSPGPTPRWQSSNEVLSVEEYIRSVSPFSGGYDYAPSF